MLSTLYLRFGLIILLCGLTLSLPYIINQYSPISGNLILNPQLDKGLEHWHTQKKNSHTKIIKIENDFTQITSINGPLHLKQSIELPDTELIQLVAHSGTTNIIQGKKKWQKAKIFIVGQSKGKNIWKSYLGLFALIGNNESQLYKNTKAIPSQLDALSLHIQIPNTNGVISYQHLGLYAVGENSTYKLFTWALIILWASSFIYLIYPELKQKKNRVLVIFSLIILFFILIPAYFRNEIIAVLEQFLSPLFASNGEDNFILNGMFDGLSLSLILTQLGHLLLFFILSLLVFIIEKKINIKSLLALVLFAAVTEIIQVFADGRTSSLADFYMDLVGIGIAALIVGLFLKVK